MEVPFTHQPGNAGLGGVAYRRTRWLEWKRSGIEWRDVTARLTRGIVGNSQVPYRIVGDGPRNVDVARIETTRDGSAGVGEG